MPGNTATSPTPGAGAGGQVVVKRKKKPSKQPEPGPGKPAEFASRPMEAALKGYKKQLAAAQREADANPSAATPQAPRRAPVTSSATRRATPRAKSQAPEAPPALSEADQDALSMAMVGVQRLGDQGPRRVTRADGADSRTAEVAHLAKDAEGKARSRLDALVAGGVAFRVSWQEEFVEGQRKGDDPRILRRLSQRRRADTSLDLHGLHSDEARREITRFVRHAYREGLELVCLVHGKGLHSEGGQSVLRETSVEALTDTGCAPCVLAFCTAPSSLGGTGALLVQLAR